MKDDTAKGKVILNKTDKSSGEPLKGVEFELRDSKGKVLETLKTDAAGHAESKLYEIATFKNGKYDTAIKYYLVETKTLDGYTLDQTKHEVTFAYANDSTPVVEITRSRIGSQIFVLSPVFGAFDTFVSSWDCGVSGVFGVSGTSGFSFVRLKVTSTTGVLSFA